MTQPVTIRIAHAADAAALSLLGGATMLETYAEKIAGPDIVVHCMNKHSVGVYSALLANPKITIWLTETVKGAAIGYLVLTPATLPDGAAHPDDVEVQRIYVLSRFHGAGIGHRLMNIAIDSARVDTARQVVLGVLKTNTRAVSFYLRQGFLQIGTRRFQVGSSVFDDWVLARAL